MAFSQGSSGSSERRKGRLPSDEGREDASDDAVLAQGVRDNQLTPSLRDASASPDETASRGTHERSRGQGGRGKRRVEPRRVFRGPTGRATRRFTSAVSGGSERRALGSPRRRPVGGRPRKTSERTAARSEPFVHTDCRAERG